MALAPSLKHLTGLKHLRLCSEPLEPDQASALSSCLSGLVSLERIDMKEVRFEAQHVATMLPSFTALRHLELSNDAFTCSAAAICPALSSLTALTHLDLAENNLWKGDQDLTAIASVLSLLPYLSHLDLGIYNHSSNLTLGNDAMSALGHSLPPSLMYLSLAGDWFGADGILAMVPGLQRLTALETLRLDNNIFGDDSVEDRVSCLQALAGCMQRMPALTYLDLGGNSLEGGSALALAGCLQHMPNAQYLDLNYNDLRDGGVRHLAGSLQRMLKLKCLILSSNSIGDDGAAGLAGSLAGLPSLIKINLSGNALTGTALRSFKSALVALSSVGRQQVTNLEVFDLSGNNLGGLRSAGSTQALTSCL